MGGRDESDGQGRGCIATGGPTPGVQRKTLVSCIT